ncbi:prenyltransferase, UbiA family protein [Massariosphaeria phaeospora]|uniref:Prenyltransferase, UbiA family protein n=1 Tax=Massariosphaeria phaeospora TaxID=100035 RepID=A0A7C8M9C7_9PLEO|nr:prenyltransferase, UbiA family protein [Massariosphaeria phaeospora]
MERKQNGNKVSSNGRTHHGEQSAPPQLFDGVNMAAWVRRLPSSWIPYVQLARLSPPVPILLIFFPHLFGVAYVAAVQHTPFADTFRVTAILFGASIFLSNAIHGWNDLIDAPIDAKIQRTKNRPIPRGAISPRAAFVFTASQALLAGCFLFLLPAETAWYSIPAVVTNYYYPYSKRHIQLPQLVLGMALQWAVVLGTTAIGLRNAWTNKSVLCLFFASLLWTVVYDTVYGYQDYEEDLKLGVGSTAVLFGKSKGKIFLWLLSNSIVALLWASGSISQMSIVYFTIAVGGCFVSLNLMTVYVDIRSPDSCAWWFVYGFWGPALSISAGLLSEYYFR